MPTYIEYARIEYARPEKSRNGHISRQMRVLRQAGPVFRINVCYAYSEPSFVFHPDCRRSLFFYRAAYPDFLYPLP